MIKPLGGHDPLELKAVVVGIPFLYSSYLMLLRIPFGILSQWLEPWQTDLWNLMAFCWAVGKFLLHGTGGETKQRAEVYAKHHSKSVAECPRTYLPAVVLWYLIFLSVGKIVTLRKHQLIETLCGIVTISARLCQGEFHISRFKCLTKPEGSHRSSQEPEARFLSWDWRHGKESYGKDIFMNQIEQRLENRRLMLQRSNVLLSHLGAGKVIIPVWSWLCLGVEWEWHLNKWCRIED